MSYVDGYWRWSARIISSNNLRITGCSGRDVEVAKKLAVLALTKLRDLEATTQLLEHGDHPW